MACFVNVKSVDRIIYPIFRMEKSHPQANKLRDITPGAFLLI